MKSKELSEKDNMLNETHIYDTGVKTMKEVFFFSFYSAIERTKEEHN